MAINLEDLILSLKREVSPPGLDIYGSISDAEWLGHLTDAFWEARLSGLLGKYTETNGEIVPINPSDPDIPRDMQQLIVLFAGFRMALTSFSNVNSSFRAKAGPVEYEVQKSAQVIKGLLDALKARLDFVLKNLSVYGVSGTSVAIFDAVIEASYSTASGPSSWYVGG